MTSGWDIATAVGTVGASAFAAIGTWLSLTLYKDEKGRRAEDEKRFGEELKAAEGEQARKVTARVEAADDAMSIHTVENGSDFDVNNCTTIFRTYRPLGGDEYNLAPPYLLGHVDLGVLEAHGKVERRVLDADALWEGAPRPAFVRFTDANGRHWLRDRQMAYHRLGPKGEIPLGEIPEFDQWLEELPEGPKALPKLPE